MSWATVFTVAKAVVVLVAVLCSLLVVVALATDNDAGNIEQ